jgi:DNA-binding NarL/FixJ family response regulator
MTRIVFALTRARSRVDAAGAPSTSFVWASAFRARLAGRLGSARSTPRKLSEQAVGTPETSFYDSLVTEHSLDFPQLRPFTRREIEVLELASQGMTNSEIAGRLELSVHAIKFHLAAVYRKLGVANRTEAAVAYALSARNGNGHAP